MNFIQNLQNILIDLDSNKQIRYFLITASIAGSISLGLIFYGRNKANKAIQEMRTLNTMRIKAKELLEKNIIVEQKKQEVESILRKDNSFKIKEFFDQILRETNLQEKSTKEPEIGSAKNLNNGYNEIKLEASFSDITMQDITELIMLLEKNPRIFTKDLVMSRNKSNPKSLDMTITIATLQSNNS